MSTRMVKGSADGNNWGDTFIVKRVMVQAHRYIGDDVTPEEYARSLG